MNTGAPVPVVTLDGPGGSGKGTVGQLLAEKLGWHFLDSGALYRVLAVAAQRNSIATDDAAGLGRLAEEIEIHFHPRAGREVRVMLDGRDVSEIIRHEDVGRMASELAVLPAVRRALLHKQHAMRRPPGLVADGRDMGTAVFKDAALKVYLTATPEVRAQRRYKQLKEKGFDVNLSRLVTEIRERDGRDASRRISPLTPAEDAIVIDTSALTVDEVVDRIWRLWHERHERVE